MPGLPAIRLALVLAVLAVLPHYAQAFTDNRTAGLKLAMRSVVSILPQWNSRPPSAEEPEGSGVAVADGRLVLTADHILGNPVSVRIRTIDGEIHAARIFARDSAADLALLELDEPLPALRFDDGIAIGEPVCALGNAFGLGVSATCGTVSAVDRSGIGFNTIEDFIQTDAAVNPGTSGGALIDHDGNLVGVLSAIFTKQSDANIGVNFAVSVGLRISRSPDFAREPALPGRRLMPVWGRIRQVAQQGVWVRWLSILQTTRWRPVPVSNPPM